jgi:protein-disulfide isomerase
MVSRRSVTSGLLASAASLLTSCGGGLPGSDAPTQRGVETLGYGKPAKKKWQAFGNGYAAAPVGRKKRTSPATVAELMVPGPIKEMSLGNPHAKVTVIEYFSLTCPVCHRFHQKVWPAFKRRYIDSGKIHFIAREFPIGHASGHASIALRCAGEKNYFKLLNRFLAQQNRWVSQEVRLAAIHSVAAPFGLTRAGFDSCIKNQDIVNGIKLVKQRGRDLGVIGTPTFFINGTQLRGVVTMAQMRAQIDPLLA